jgi:hypothetical protein
MYWTTTKGRSLPRLLTGKLICESGTRPGPCKRVDAIHRSFSQKGAIIVTTVKYYKWVEALDNQDVVFRLRDGNLQRKDGEFWYEADDWLLSEGFLVEVEEPKW